MPKSTAGTPPPATATVVLPKYDPNQWFTIEEAAALLKVSPRRMRRWVYNGAVGSEVLPGGRGRRISGAHLNAAMGG
jgi:excisionase family DNA binding protein